MSVPERKKRINGSKVKVIARAINSPRTKRRASGFSNVSARWRKRSLTAIQPLLADDNLILERRPCLMPIRALFVSVRDLEDARFGERFAEELQSDWQWMAVFRLSESAG